MIGFGIEPKKLIKAVHQNFSQSKKNF